MTTAPPNTGTVVGGPVNPLTGTVVKDDSEAPADERIERELLQEKADLEGVVDQAKTAIVDARSRKRAAEARLTKVNRMLRAAKGETRARKNEAK